MDIEYDGRKGKMVRFNGGITPEKGFDFYIFLLPPEEQQFAYGSDVIPISGNGDFVYWGVGDRSAVRVSAEFVGNNMKKGGLI